MSEYMLIPNTRSICAQCGFEMTLLTCGFLSLPSFYICFVCKRVGEVGKGPVK